MARKAKARKTRTPAAKAASRRPKPATKAVAAAASPKRQLLDSLAREHATTLKVLRALPADQTELRPHPRAKSARELAWIFVIEQYLLHKALTDQLTFTGSGGPPPAPGDYQAIIAQFEKDHAAVVDLLKKTPDAKLATTVQFPVGPGKMGDWSKVAFAWFILSDQIHHRGQLSVYVRMAGGKVPSIYGPSADEPWR